MINTSDLNVLLSNVISENQYSHCRLCLKFVEETYVKFDDYVSYETNELDSIPKLSELLHALVGNEICDEVSGINAVCLDCAEQAIGALKFVEKCKASTKLLNKIFSNLIGSVDIDINPSKNQNLLIVVTEDECKILLENKQAELDMPSEIFSCKECHMNFDNISKLKNHHLTAYGILFCELCHETFTDEEDYNLHTNVDHKFKCPECSTYHLNPRSLKEHINNVHTSHICKNCGKKFNGLESLQTHEQDHTSKSICPKCGKVYVTRESYHRHVKLCTQGQLEPHPFRSKCSKSFFCSQCGKGYSTPGGLRVHQRFSHGNAKHHTCKECGRKFTAPSYLKAHMVTHTKERNFICNICHRSFVTKEALIYHVRRHTGEKPYSCDLCKEHFVNASARAEHIKFKHNPPKHTCDVCSKKFYTSSFLNKHKNKHYVPKSRLYIGRNKSQSDILRSETAVELD